MFKNIDYNELAILVDFDGTITTEDTNDKIMEVYGYNDDKFLKEYKEGKITFTEYFQSEVSGFRLTEEEYIRFLLEDIKLSPGFLEFYKSVKERNIPLGIISGGFENGILAFLKEYGIEDIEVFANKLVFDGDRSHIEFIDGENSKCCDKGPCGNCKIKHYYKYKEKKKNVIFVGDGITDMPVANVAEVVFAKDDLANYLDKENIDYIPYKDFNDIDKLIFQ